MSIHLWLPRWFSFWSCGGFSFYSSSFPPMGSCAFRNPYTSPLTPCSWLGNAMEMPYKKQQAVCLRTHPANGSSTLRTDLIQRGASRTTTPHLTPHCCIASHRIASLPDPAFSLSLTWISQSPERGPRQKVAR
ncbi:hypothetical protein F5Y14DRAFT_260545 [Nemania sp. NC0429]|nr:hypothetical protein F5Y14DRAFT_260545 [Nemania sp. NC0429]